jgi:hypothetical protein
MVAPGARPEVNKGQLAKNVGDYFRLRPQARDERGAPIDDDWIVRSVDATRVQLQNARTGQPVVLGFDHINDYLSDPQRDAGSVHHGFLRLHVELIVKPTSVEIEPLLGPRSVASSRAFQGDPLIIDAGGKRLFSWRGRDPLHLIEGEEPPMQRLGYYTILCDALRAASGREPEFAAPERLTGELVYELSPDFQAKWRLLGGNDRRPGTAVLVLTERRAQGPASAVEGGGSGLNEVWVDLEYASRSGLQGRLEQSGFTVRWIRDDRLARAVELEGWEKVVEQGDLGPQIFKVSSSDSNLTLAKKRRGNS